MNTSVVGVTFGNHQKNIAILNANKDNAYVYLVREENNKWDKNAVKVMARIKNQYNVELGYINKNLAKTIATIMDSKSKVWVNAFKIKYYAKNFNMTLELVNKHLKLNIK